MGGERHLSVSCSPLFLYACIPHALHALPFLHRRKKEGKENTLLVLEKAEEKKMSALLAGGLVRPSSEEEGKLPCYQPFHAKLFPSTLRQRRLSVSGRQAVGSQAPRSK